MLVAAICRFFSEQRLSPRSVVVAVSGGVDSTALLLAMAEERQAMEVIAAHVNHHLRGDESDGDEAFVRDLCRSLGIPLQVADGTLDPASVRDRGIEAAAREVRFARLHEIRRAARADFIATAHQKNDQAETLLMRLMNGGGPAALRGIHPVREDGIIRPLLEVTRSEIVEWLDTRGVQPRIDRSNGDLRFLRNRVRAFLRDVDPSAIYNLARTAAQAQSQWCVLERAVDAAEDVAHDDRSTTFRSMPGDRWLRQALLHRHIVRLDPAQAREVSAHDLERLATELERIPGEGSGADDAGPPRSRRLRISVTRSLELLQSGPHVVLRRIGQPSPPFDVPLAPDHEAWIESLGLTVRVERADSAPGAGQRICLPPGSEPRFTVRNRQPGDRFHPLGYPAPTKLKDFLINRKIAREQRDRLPLLIWGGEIVWIAGVEVSERFKTTSREGDVYVVSAT
jgi:tRNA(Ile)-lysidine synthase